MLKETLIQMKLNKKLLAAVLIGLMTMTGSALAAENVTAKDAGISKGTAMQTEQKLQLEEKWDKVFPKSNKVEHKKVTFHNRYGITLAADMYVPKNSNGKKFPALAVAGPFGAVKEQCSGLYAQTMAERGFLTIAFDPSFTGESGGNVRYVASPDINTEDFSAAVDYLSTLDNVDPGHIGIIGICGWGYFDAMDEDARYKAREAMNAQRTEDYKNGSYKLAGGLPDERPAEPKFFSDYWDYYKTPRGYHKRSLNSNGGWNVTSALSFMNMPQLSYAGEIRNAVLVIHGEKAHSRYFGEDAFKKLKGGNKELMIIPGASHTDLYDQVNIIPFDKIDSFFHKYL